MNLSFFTSATAPTNRPLIVTILSGYIFVQWAITLINLLLVVIFTLITPMAKPIAWGYVADQISNMILGFSMPTSGWMIWGVMAALAVGLIGYWFMQRWAVIIYAAATVALFIFLVHTVVLWNNNIIYNLMSNFLFPVALTICGVIYFKQMK